MDIVIAGGTGFIGRSLCRMLVSHGHRVTVLTRHASDVARLFGSSVQAVEWDAARSGAWERSLVGARAVINLAGASIADARWTERRKRVLLESRLNSTRLLVRACERLAVRPDVMVNASGVGYYGAQRDDVLDESRPAGHGFLADLCVQWEAAAQEASFLGIRVVCLRNGMVLGHDGGALPRMALPFRFYLGGPVMPGTQWVSWIHRDDVVRLIEWVVAAPAVIGPVNAVAPAAVTMNDFSRTLGRVLHRPSWIPVPEVVLTTALGQLASVMTTGQRVAPVAAQRSGYRFQYPDLEGALRVIMREQ